MSELRKDNLSFVEALGQSVANVSPTLTPALAVAVVAGMAGSASWLVYVFATIALLIVGINVGKLAGKIPAAGSFFIYVSRSLGPSYGMLAGWSMLAAYIFTAMALTVATSIFIKTFFTSIGYSGAIPNTLLYLLISIGIWAFACRDINISARIGLTLEVSACPGLIIRPRLKPSSSPDFPMSASRARPRLEKKRRTRRSAFPEPLWQR
jgi:amino acid transporter